MIRTITIHRDNEPIDLEVEAQWFAPEPEWGGVWEPEGCTVDGEPFEPTSEEWAFIESELQRIDCRAEWTDDFDDPDYVDVYHRSMP